MQCLYVDSEFILDLRNILNRIDSFNLFRLFTNCLQMFPPTPTLIPSEPSLYTNMMVIMSSCHHVIMSSCHHVILISDLK